MTEGITGSMLGVVEPIVLPLVTMVDITKLSNDLVDRVIGVLCSNGSICYYNRMPEAYVDAILVAAIISGRLKASAEGRLATTVKVAVVTCGSSTRCLENEVSDMLYTSSF